MNFLKSLVNPNLYFSQNLFNYANVAKKELLYELDKITTPGSNIQISQQKSLLSNSINFSILYVVIPLKD